MIKKVLILLIVVLIVSCSGNSTYFDLEKKGIISCDESLISKVVIRGKGDNFDYYRFSLKENLSGIGVKFFDITTVNDSFNIYIDSGETITNSEFKLKSSSKYEISNISKGDTAKRWITFSTDEKGNIINASVLSCK